MVKETKDETNKVNEIELVETVKETGIGLRMPNGEVLDLREVDVGTARWMVYVTETLDKLRKNLVG